MVITWTLCECVWFIEGLHYMMLCKPGVNAELVYTCSLLQTHFQHYNLKMFISHNINNHQNVWK